MAGLLTHAAPGAAKVRSSWLCLAQRSFSAATSHGKLSVSIIGSGNWGSVAGRIVAQNVLRSDQFNPTVRMWVHEEEVEPGLKLSDVINREQENVKYLPGVKLGTNLKAIPDLAEAVQGSNLLVFVTPHQFVRRLCPQIKSALGPDAKAISLIKGMHVSASGFELVSQLIQHELGIPCSVLMGANIASEIGREQFSEATIGYDDGDSTTAEVWTKLFHTPYFHVRAVPDAIGCELCGTLKNIVALSAGFVDGLDLGSNTKAAIMRIGLMEMRQLAQEFFPTVQSATFFESAGVADLITSCIGGRNRKCAEAYVRNIRCGESKTWEELESELLAGQKLQGVLTSHGVQAVLRSRDIEAKFPFFTTINRICTGEIPPEAITRYAEHL